MQQGMTIKQFNKCRFLDVCQKLWAIRKNMTDENKREFIELSIEAHILKGHVPKSLWSLVNKERVTL